MKRGPWRDICTHQRRWRLNPFEPPPNALLTPFLLVLLLLLFVGLASTLPPLPPASRPLSMNGTKNNAKELDQRKRIDQVSLTVPESLRWRCIGEDEAGEWEGAGRLVDCFKGERLYQEVAPFSA